MGARDAGGKVVTVSTTLTPHWQMITPGCRQALEALAGLSFMGAFYLAGGTALALQIGHRLSKDLDWFSTAVQLEQTEREDIRAALSGVGGFEITAERNGMIYSRMFGSEVSFISQHHPLIEPPLSLKGLAVASPIDIGLMKLAAIKDRGTRRDFVDIFCLRQLAPLTLLIDLADQKYADRPDFTTILARALAYFDDAERQPMPELATPINWAEVKRYAEAGARYIVERERDKAQRDARRGARSHNGPGFPGISM